MVPVYQKINSRVLDPATGERRQRGNRGLAGRNRQRSLGFGALALSAFVGFRALQQLVRCIRRRQPPQTEQEALEAVLALEDDAHAAAALPPVVRPPPVVASKHTGSARGGGLCRQHCRIL